MEKKLDKKMMIIEGNDAIKANFVEVCRECEKNAAAFTLDVVNLFSNIFAMNDQNSIEDNEKKCLDLMAEIMSALSEDLLRHLRQVSSEYRKLRETDIDLEKLYDALRKAGEDND